MCGRYKLVTAPEELESYFEAIISNAGTIEPLLNVTPGMFMPVVAIGRDQIPVITTFKWGLVPSWSKDPKTGYKMINARSESITQKPSFSVPFQRRRCVVPSNGFYEWMKDGANKIPHFVHRTDDHIMSFAAIYDRWKYPDGKDLFTYSIITTSANDTIKHVHDRMPVVLGKDQIKDWLNPVTPEQRLLDMMRPLSTDLTTVEQVADPAKM
jgi:putative SOS response-associated peptidase YedK